MADPYLVHYLAERDIACPGCGYSLLGLRGDACPECGAELALRVGLADPRLGAFVATLVALSTGLGFNLFLLGCGVWSMSLRGYPGWPQLWSLVCFGSLSGALMSLLVRNRRWHRERSGAVRAALAAGAFVLSIAGVVVFLSIVG